MKINIWIRLDKNGEPALRADAKLEDRDTPTIQRWGFKLMKALMAGRNCHVEQV